MFFSIYPPILPLMKTQCTFSEVHEFILTKNELLLHIIIIMVCSDFFVLFKILNDLKMNKINGLIVN